LANLDGWFAPHVVIYRVFFPKIVLVAVVVIVALSIMGPLVSDWFDTISAYLT